MSITEKIENFISPNERRFELKMKAQFDIIEGAGGEDIAGTWIDANGRRFDEILEDPQYDFYKLLSDEKTYPEALQKIKNKLYH